MEETHNARTIENIVAAPSVGTGYRHWDMSFLLHLFNGGAVRAVERSVFTFADSASCRAYTCRSLGNDWSISHITLWTSKDSKLADRQDGRFKNNNHHNIMIQGGSYTLPPVFVFQGENLWQPHA